MPVWHSQLSVQPLVLPQVLISRFLRSNSMLGSMLSVESAGDSLSPSCLSCLCSLPQIHKSFEKKYFKSILNNKSLKKLIKKFLNKSFKNLQKYRVFLSRLMIEEIQVKSKEKVILPFTILHFLFLDENSKLANTFSCTMIILLWASSIYLGINFH